MPAQTVTAPSPPNGRALRRIRLPLRSRVTLGILFVLVTLLFVAPVAMLVVGAFRTAPPGQAGEWSVEGFLRAWTDPRTLELLGATVVLSVIVTVVSIAISISIVYVVTRTDAPGRRWVTPLMAVVFATPTLYFAISWGMLGNRQVGLINTTLGMLIGQEAHPVDINNWIGVGFVMAVKMVASHYMLLIGPFSSIDRSLEEASQVSGGGRFRTFLRVTLPVMAPTITSVMILAFVVALGALDTPLVIGTPAGVEVFSSRIFGYIRFEAAPDYAGASALSILLAVIIVTIVLTQQAVLGKRNFTTITGKSYRTEPWKLGGWRWAASAAVGVYFLLALVLPLMQLFLGSLQPFFGLWSNLGFGNYAKIFARSDLSQAVTNTIVLGVFGGCAAMIVAFALLLVARRFPGRLTRTMILFTWLPWALPGVVLGLAMSWAFFSVPGLSSLYGTVWVLGIALMVAVVPLAARSLDGPLQGVSAELEESARTSGAGVVRTSIGITVRLLSRSFLSGWFITGLVIASNFDVPMLLSTSTNPSVPVIAYQLYTQGDTPIAAALFCLLIAFIVVGYAAIQLLSFIVRNLIRTVRRQAPAALHAKETV
ncbi:ABC transporter permease [Agromyces archimandritae]|uniref:Iron ABC transporter permease n=1 Tax=Agromyces archimandritae TaxID=2781962 RepID=A0A975FKW9_9MICO|nr:iron ABC transporter permease [Agromyces archimandritae]QTX04395.1 iron ABC transporter permease [Agromyces archimandritae]